MLCEDLQAWVFVYRALLAAGAEPRDIRRRPYPDSRFNAAGGGSPRLVEGYQVYACGSQHVRENFPRELALLRKQQRMGRDVALVVHVDVDNETASGRSAADRLRELDRASASAEPPVPAPIAGDRLARLVPRRALETWIKLFIDGPPVDEHTAYPHLTGHEGDAAPAAEAFVAHARENTAPALVPPSMMTGFDEMMRVIG